MKTVFITGAAGFIGSHAAYDFKKSGWRVVGTDRYEAKWDLYDDFYVCDLLDGHRLKEIAVKVDPDLFLHLGAEIRVEGLKWSDYAVNIEGVSNVIDAVNSLNSCERVIYASTRLICPVYSPSEHLWDYRPPNMYGASKVEGEKLVRNTKSNVPWVMVRPTGIWGPGFRSPSYRDFFVQVRKGRYFHVNGINPSRTFGYVGNTVYQLLSLAEAPLDKVNGSVHYLGDYEPLQVREWADMIAHNFSKRALMELPQSLTKTIACFGDALLKMGITQFPLNSSRFRNMSADSVYDLSDLAAVAPDLPFSLEEATKLTTDWMMRGEDQSPFE